MLMCSCLIHRNLAPPALLAFRWAASLCALIPTEWFTVLSLSYILPNPSELACFQPPETLSVNKHRVHHQPWSIIYGNITFSSCWCFPLPKWKTSKNEVPPAPKIMDWNCIFSQYCEQKILEICLCHRWILYKLSHAYSSRFPRFFWSCVCARARERETERETECERDGQLAMALRAGYFLAVA